MMETKNKVSKPSPKRFNTVEMIGCTENGYAWLRIAQGYHLIDEV